MEAGCQLSLRTANELAVLLNRYLPDNPPRSLTSHFGGSRFHLLRAYSLKAALDDKTLEMNDLAHLELRKELEKQNAHYDSQDAREFKENVGALLPWHQLWIRIFLGKLPKDRLGAAITDTRTASSKAAKISYREESNTSNEIVQLWFDILVMAGGSQVIRLNEFDAWIASLKHPLFTTTLNNITRIAARHEPTQTRSFNYARQSLELTNNVREDANSKVTSYIDIARAVLAVSKSEASAYFDHAVEVASNIGDENLDRWSSILYLAARAADPGKPIPEVAYKLSRCAELTYDYIDRKYFDWETTVRAIAALCPSSCMTILSRWRDRQFGRSERLLPEAIKFLVENRSLDPLAPLSLIGFRAEWDEAQLLSSALEACESKLQKSTVSNYFYRYMRLDEHSVSTWRKVNIIATSHGLALDGIDEVIAFSERKKHSRQSNDHNFGNSVSPREAQRDWNATFSGLDLNSPNGISDAYRRFKSSEPPWYADHFFREACKRIEVGQEDKFIRALAEVPQFELYELRKFLEQFPNDWKQRLVIKSALRDTLKVYCRRYCMEITKSRYYEVLPISTAREFCDLSESDIANIILDAISETTEELTSGRLFTLTGLLALRINQDEALDTLRFGLDLFNEFLKEDDGDGEWSIELAPPANINGAVAGYIWTGLAAPNSSLRWQAAHAVRGLCVLDRGDILKELISLAETGKAGPFADRTLHFYELHALQWLLIALARAAMESPNAIKPFSAFLMNIALNNQHVLIRDFAANAILALTNSQHLSVDDKTTNKLISINTPSLPVEFPKNWDRVDKQRGRESTTSQDWEYYFGLDIGPYWLSSLGQLFALTQADISIEVANVIECKWGFGSREIWRNDQRRYKHLFSEGETSHSHGSTPETDDLEFYLAYHGMMVVAGKLLLNRPLHQSSEDPENEFQQWLDSHKLSREDGNWLADRRDPQPFEWPDWKNQKEDTDEWPWSIHVSDFDRLLGITDKRINTWGHWTTKFGKRKESVRISSAFVSCERSNALLRALQTTTNSIHYGIPDADSDLQINQGEYQLKGWLVDRTRGGGLDEFDPWSGDIRFPSIRPGSEVLEVLPIVSDVEGRAWKREDSNQNVLWCEIWGRHQNKDDDNAVEQGRRLIADFGYLTDLLNRTNKDLIIEVQIERDILHYRYERKNDFGYIPPYTKIYLLKSDGRFYTV